MDIKIYTDGACSGNPGPGGWACLLSTILDNGQLYETEHYGGYRLTTNNRMELVAVINGLRSINGKHDIEVISDSSYVCKAFNEKWIYGWVKKNWKGVKNSDLWKQLYQLLKLQNSYKFTLIK